MTCCVFGDGAVAEGEFHESMNLASLWKLPVLFLCENNLYAMGTALRFEHSVTELVKKADAYNVAAAAVDGMDVIAVKAATQKALDYIRSGNGPYFLECRTYRFRAHSMFDAELYRSKTEVEEWKNRDPISNLSARLKREGVITDADVEEMERKVADEVAKAVNFAEAGTWEQVEDLTRFVYSERGTS